MRNILAVIVVLSFSSLGASNLTITPSDDGSDLLWLSWTDVADTGAVAKYNGPVMEAVRYFPDEVDGVSSSITEDPSGGAHIMLSKRNMLLSLDASGSFATEDSIQFDEMTEWCISGLLRRSTDAQFGLLSRYMPSYVSSGADYMWITREFTVSEPGVITPGDSLILSDPYPVRGSDYPYDLVHNLVYPVVNAAGYPVMAERQAVPGGSFPPTPGSFYISTQCHNTTASAVYLTADTLTWSTTDSTEPEILASGSNSATAIFLWSDSTETVYYSLHDCETGIVSTIPFPGQGPSNTEAAAISANPADPGLLLVWHNGTDLVCRHYQSSWNDYAYVIQENVPYQVPGNIAVCSVANGYWVAYSMYPEVPVVFFVDRSNVTSIESFGEGMEPVSVSACPNPFSESLSLSLPATGSIQAELFDTAGRMVLNNTSESGTVLWNTAHLPSGTYLVRVTAGDTVFSEKVVLVK